MNGDVTVWCNGSFVRADEVKISPFDLGVTVGLGVFETLVAYNGSLFAWDRHYARMVAGAEVLGINRSHLLSKSDLQVVMEDVVKANHLTDGRARVRVSFSGGSNPFSGGDSPGNVIVTAVALPEALPHSLASLALVDSPCMEGSGMARVKSASFVQNVLAWRAAQRMGADEAVRLNTSGFLCEGAMSNLFLVKDQTVITPSLESGCLAGVTREIVLELCSDLGLNVVEDLVEADILNEADEIFITSSAREVQAAKLIKASESNNSITQAGPITQLISKAYNDEIKKKLGFPR